MEDYVEVKFAHVLARKISCQQIVFAQEVRNFILLHYKHII